MKSQTLEEVVVTGASAGVGRAVVQASATRAAHIGQQARGHAGLEGAQTDVEAAGGKAIVIPTDTSDADQVEAAAAKVEETFGPINIWVNGATASVCLLAAGTTLVTVPLVIPETYAALCRLLGKG